MRLFILQIVLFLPCFLSPLAAEDKSVLLAILAKNKAHTLPKYLNCIENIDYDKQKIILYINTNNNQDATATILEEWVEKNRPLYKKILFKNHTIPNEMATRPHEWIPTRFKTLGNIRNQSLQKAKKYACDYYFVVDCDNFIAPYTLKVLMEKDKPIIAPMLYALPEQEDYYSNFFADITETGYYHPHPDYIPILHRQVIGTFKVPVVHCTYLIQASYLDSLSYLDDTEDYEFVVFSRIARKNNIAQYICNEYDFGTLLHFYKDLSLEEEVKKTTFLFESLTPKVYNF